MATEKVSGPVVGVSKAAANEQLTPVVKTAAVVQKQSSLKRLWKGFFAEDLKTVGGSIRDNVIIPSIKNGIANALTGAIWMWLFGKNSNVNQYNNYRPLWNGGNIVNYQNMYRVQNGVISQPGTTTINNAHAPQTVTPVNTFRSTDVYDPSMFVYATWQDAENVFISLCQRISNYGVATVRNLYDLSGATAVDTITVNWGWYDLPNHQIVPTGNGTWILKLPQPTYLNK